MKEENKKYLAIFVVLFVLLAVFITATYDKIPELQNNGSEEISDNTIEDVNENIGGPICNWETYRVEDLGIEMLVNRCESGYGLDFQIVASGTSLFFLNDTYRYPGDENLVVELYPKDANTEIIETIQNNIISFLNKDECKVIKDTDLLTHTNIERFTIKSKSTDTAESTESISLGDCGHFNAPGSYFEYHPEETTAKYFFVRTDSLGNMLDPNSIKLFDSEEFENITSEIQDNSKDTQPEDKNGNKNEGNKEEELSDIYNLEYQLGSDVVILKNGIFENQNPEQLSITRALLLNDSVGDLNNDGENDSAVIIVTNDVGSDEIYYVVGVISTDGEYSSINPVVIGNRIIINSINIAQNGNIVIDYLDREAAQGLFEEPTISKSKIYYVLEGELVELGSDIERDRLENRPEEIELKPIEDDS